MSTPARPSTDTRRPGVFISYAREDRESASRLAQVLEDDGLHVWWDRELIGGSVFAEEIEAELDAARVVVVLWSSASVRSEFVRDESSRALRDGKLLPVRIEEVDLPLGFGQLHTLDLIDWDGDAHDEDLQRLLADVRHMKGRPPPPTGATRARPRLRWRAPALVLLVLLALAGLGLGGWRWWQNDVADQHFRSGLAFHFGDVPQLESAFNEYLSALDRRPGHGRARYYLAHLYVQRGSRDAARDAFARALEASAVPLDRTQRAMAQTQLAALVDVPGEAAPVERVSALTIDLGDANDSEPRDGAQSSVGPLRGTQPAIAARPARSPQRVEPPATVATQAATRVDALFDPQAERRVAATSALLTDPPALSDALPLAVARSLALLDRRAPARLAEHESAGIVGTLTLLQSALPGSLRAHQAAIERLLTAAGPLGDYTRQQADQVAQRLAQVPARRPVAYIQIASDAQRPIARELASRLRASGYTTPGVERVGEQRSPSRPEVRTQGASEQGYARWIARALEDLAGAPVRTSTLRNARPQVDTYEIWLDRELCAPGGRRVQGCGPG